MACVSIGYASCPVFGMAFVDHSLAQWKKRTLNPVVFQTIVSDQKDHSHHRHDHNQLEDPRKGVQPQTVSFLPFFTDAFII